MIKLNFLNHDSLLHKVFNQTNSTILKTLGIGLPQLVQFLLKIENITKPYKHHPTTPFHLLAITARQFQAKSLH